MDWEQYKTLSHDPNYFTRWALEKTSRFLNQELRNSIQQGTSPSPLDKPLDHKGGPETDVFKLSIDLDTTNAVFEALLTEQIKASNQSDAQQKTLRGLITKWQELRSEKEEHLFSK